MKTAAVSLSVWVQIAWRINATLAIRHQLASPGRAFAGGCIKPGALTQQIAHGTSSDVNNPQPISCAVGRGCGAAGVAWGSPTDGAVESDLHERVQVCQGMVRSLAWQISRRLPRTVEVDELVGEGQIGLIHAAREYDPNKGAEFPTYAYWRIRGTMLDWVRRQEWYEPVNYHSGRMAARASVDEGAATQVADPHAVDPSQQASEDELRDLLRELIAGLGGRARSILEATLLHDRTLEEAGRAAGVHKGTAHRAQVRGFEELAAALRERGLNDLNGEELREYVTKRAVGRPRQ